MHATHARMHIVRGRGLCPHVRMGTMHACCEGVEPCGPCAPCVQARKLSVKPFAGDNHPDGPTSDHAAVSLLIDGDVNAVLLVVANGYVCCVAGVCVCVWWR